jgi:putative ATP-dependent endonuclease of the OLD family
MSAASSRVPSRSGLGNKLKIRHVSIKNFRGIRNLVWPLPEQQIFCLVGRGDSTKSTVLEAIRYVFHPQWNLQFDDADFYACKPENHIQVDIVVTDLPDVFRDLAHYGHWLSGWNKEARTHEADPGEGLEDALQVRLKVGDDLEPHWSVVKSDNQEGTPFKTSDRGKAAVSFIGAFADRHLTWGRGSILTQLTDAENINSSLARAARAARSALDARRADDLRNFDEIARTAEKTARNLGVTVVSSYKANLDADGINVRMGGLSLHDGNMPLRQLGLGSKRMLTTGLQKQGLQSPHITLCDEIEIALEPHRIARLIHHLKEDTSGQYFITTHSPVVLRELSVENLHIVHSRQGKISIVPADQPALKIQGKIRTAPEAFLAPKIIVCEGPTEVGLLRGLDSYWINQGCLSFAYQGVAMYDADGASKIREAAACLRALQYDVAVLADSDEQTQFSAKDVADLTSLGVHTAVWDGAVSVEERVFLDLPWDGVMACLLKALSIHGNEPRILDQVGAQFGTGFNRNRSSWTDTPQLRAALGKAAKAKSSGWFKTVRWGSAWADSITPFLTDDSIKNTDLVLKLDALRKWIDRD